MAQRSCAVALCYAVMLLGGETLARAAGFTHWLVTEEGKIEFQIGSPFNLRQHFNLHALLQQEERVSSLQTLRDELLNFRETFEIFGHFDSFEESFFARDPDCRNVPSITTFDLYVSTVLPLDHKGIRLSDHLDPADSLFSGEPRCTTPLDYSIYALDHLEGVQERHSLAESPEKSVLASVNMKTETFGNLVHQALEKNSTSWVLMDLATLYWRARGDVLNAIECIRRSLHYSPRYASDVAYLNLANVLHRSHKSSDAIVPLKLALEISPDTNILHYTLGNIYVSLAKFNESVSEFRYSLSLEPTSEAVISVYSSLLCEVRKIDASTEYGRKLDETQAKLDEFYDKVEMVKRAHVVEKGHRGQWDIDTSQRNSGETLKGNGDEKMETLDNSDNEDTPRAELPKSEDIGTHAPSEDGTSGKDNSLVLSINGTTDSVMPHNRGNAKFRLVLRPLCDEGCSKCDHDHSTVLDRFPIEQPVCRLPSPFLNHSQLPSGYCADTRRDCLEIERRGKPGMNFCEVKGHSTVFSYTRESPDVATGTRSSLSCPVDDTTRHNDCLKRLRAELRLAKERREEQRERMMERKRGKIDSTDAHPKPEKPVSESSTDDKIAKKDDQNIVPDKKTKESDYSKIFKSLEFLPYNPLPMELEELIFPERSRPLKIFDDPYWPDKASCVRLVETLGSASSSSLSSYTGTYLSPNAKGANTGSYFKIVPYPVPPYLRQQPRCTDIVELPFSLQAMDHLHPVQYRSRLVANKRQSENGLKQVFINAVSDAMGHTLSFEESGEAVYAAMVKNGPNWGLFVVASLYWRVSGDPKHSIECLRRALHYSPSSVKDVGYVALANVFHRHGYMKEAVIAARASLDVLERSPVGHYTLAGIYLTLRDYTASSLHLRTALHLQPSFEHALSALRLVRCFLKLSEEQQQLKQKLNQPEGKVLKTFESILTADMSRAIEILRRHERVREPPNVTTPDDVILREGERSAEEIFTGEDAIKYITNLAILRSKRKERESREGERERREKEDIERRLREEIVRVENDGSLEEFLKRKREQEGENEFEKKVHYQPNQLDITPLMQQVASRIQAEQNNYDPQLIAQSRTEIETELRDIVLASARAVANNQSPVQHTTPVRVIRNGAQPSLSTLTEEQREEERETSREKDGETSGDERVNGGDERVNGGDERVNSGDERVKSGSSERGKGREEAGDEKDSSSQKRERYPGYQPWPTLQECAAMSLPKTLIFTSTWLSVTAKKIKVTEHVDFESTLENTSLKPYCPANIPESAKTFPNLAGMSGIAQVDRYKPERGLIEVFTNLSGSYRSIEDVATRINISMSKNKSSWVLSNLAALYWRIYGEGELAINCLRHALFFSDHGNKEVALVSLANVLFRMGYESDATAVMQHSLEVNPKLVVNHFTMANLLAARGFAAESASYFEATLQFQPGFEPAAERLQAVRCITLLKHIQVKREKEERRQREYEAELEKKLYEHRKSMGHFD